MISPKCHRDCAQFYKELKRLKREYETMSPEEREASLAFLKARDQIFNESFPLEERIEAINFYNPVTIKRPVLQEREAF